MSKTKLPDIKPANTKKYRLAANGAGIVVCQQRSTHSFRALLSMRSRVVGVGYGITGGGFVELKDIFKQPVGYVTQTAEEAYRESFEENLGFKELISLEDFLERAQSISTFHVRVNDLSCIHGTNYYALTVTDEEWDLIAALPGSNEREGALIEVWGDFIDTVLHRNNAHEQLSLLLPDGRPAYGGFYHKHEELVFGQIAWHVQQGYLWKPQ